MIAKKPISLLLCFALPAFFLIGGLVIAGLYGYRQIPSLTQESGMGFLPEGFSMTLEEAASYTVWLTVVPKADANEGAEKLPPGGRLYIFDEASGRELKLSQWAKATKYVGDAKSVSLGTFVTTRPKQMVELKGAGFNMPVPVSVAPTNMKRVLGVVLTLLAIVCVTLMVSITALIAMLHQRQKTVEAALS
tara:strand:- start:6011 stop:6583 length:573 start_codon:yes stop_codon:yes gene_type:complete